MGCEQISRNYTTAMSYTNICFGCVWILCAVRKKNGELFPTQIVSSENYHTQKSGFPSLSLTQNPLFKTLTQKKANNLIRTHATEIKETSVPYRIDIKPTIE